MKTKIATPKTPRNWRECIKDAERQVSEAKTALRKASVHLAEREAYLKDCRYFYKAGATFHFSPTEVKNGR
jgi:hypothetical protein